MSSFTVIVLLLTTVLGQSTCDPFGLRIYYVSVSLKSNNIISNISCSTKAINTSSFMNYYVAYIHVCSTNNAPFEESFSYTAYGWNATQTANSTPYKEQWINVKLIDPRVSTRSLKMIVLADWGTIEANQMTPITDYLSAVLNSTDVNAVMVAGDIGYDLDTTFGAIYQDFLALMEIFSKKLPFFIAPGNHERRTVDAALLFNETFKVYGVDKKLATGIYYGSVFLTMFDPYNYVYGKNESISCLDALKTQLQKGIKSGRFIIPYSHYALVCSGEFSRCDYNYNRLKIYLGTMYDNGVRLYIGAHTHSYERTYPLLRNGSFVTQSSPYSFKQQYIVSIVEGVSGNNNSILATMPTVQSFTPKYTVNQTGFGLISSSPNYVTYEHYSTKQGFMDKIIIQNSSSKQAKDYSYIALGVVIGLAVIFIIFLGKHLLAKLLQPQPKVQIKSEQVDITEMKESVIIEEPKLSIQIQ